MAQTDSSERSRDRDPDRDDSPTSAERRSSGVAEWFAESTIRIAVAILGVILLLFAVGQMVGIDLLGGLADALDTQIGRWLLVAVFAIFLIVVALRGFYAQPD